MRTLVKDRTERRYRGPISDSADALYTMVQDEEPERMVRVIGELAEMVNCYTFNLDLPRPVDRYDGLSLTLYRRLREQDPEDDYSSIVQEVADLTKRYRGIDISLPRLSDAAIVV